MIMSYAVTHEGRLPDNWQEMVSQSDVPLRLQSLVCPASGDTPPRGPTTQSIVADLTAGGHVSYVYLGRGKTTKTLRRDTVLVYEALPRHEGMTVLYADGHMEFIARNSAVLLLQNIASESAASTHPTSRPANEGG